MSGGAEEGKSLFTLFVCVCVGKGDLLCVVREGLGAG